MYVNPVRVHKHYGCSNVTYGNLHARVRGDISPKEIPRLNGPSAILGVTIDHCPLTGGLPDGILGRQDSRDTGVQGWSSMNHKWKTVRLLYRGTSGHQRL